MDYDVKVVLIGCPLAGKTCLLISYLESRFPDLFIPKTYPESTTDLVVDDHVVHLSVTDTARYEEYGYLRYLAYTDSDVILICFPVDERHSLTEVEELWLPEVRLNRPNTPIILVACKADVRDVLNIDALTYEDGLTFAEKNDLNYSETSALMGKGLNKCFIKAVRLAFETRRFRGKGVHGMFDQDTFEKAGHSKPNVCPKKGDEPKIHIQESSFGDDLYKLYLNPVHYDVVFVCEDQVQFNAHSIILCSASTVFAKLFGYVKETQGRRRKAYWKDVNEGKVHCFKKIYKKTSDDDTDINKTMTVIHTGSDVPSRIFKLILEFLYRGSLYELSINDHADLERCAVLFELSTLFQVGAILLSKSEYYLPQDIANYNNTRTGNKLKDIFLNNADTADTIFYIKGKIIYAHKCILIARSEVMAAMLGGNFIEACKTYIDIPDTSEEAFMTLLVYLYSNESPPDSYDLLDTLVLADRYNIVGLLNRCEMRIARRLETFKEQTCRADKDVFRILDIAKKFNAVMLSKWCLYYIAHNYVYLYQLEEFSLLSDDDRFNVEENR